MGTNETEQSGAEKPGFLGGLMSKVTGMFKKEDGGMNWGSIIGMVAGGALAMFAGPMLGLGEGIMGMLLPAVGVIGGLFAGKAIGDRKASPEQEEVVQASMPSRTHGAGHQTSVAMQQDLPAMRPKAGAGRGSMSV